MPRVDLVISRYAADISWAKSLCANLFVYEKGNGPCGFPVTRLRNVGKCDHVFLHHIVEHYHDLADWTLFCPDHPFDHLNGMTIEEGLEPSDEVKAPWLCQVKDWGEDGRIRWESFTNRPDRNGTNWTDRYKSGKIQRAELDLVSWSKQLLGYNPNDNWPGYSPGGILGVPKRSITYLPLAFYARLRDALGGSVECEEGHYCERSWIAIFAGLCRFA